MKRYLCSVLLLLCVSCSTTKPTSTTTMNSGDFDKLTEDILYGSLALSPVTATQTGYHEHNGLKLDELLDDYSTVGVDGQRKFYEDTRARINSLNSASLDKEQQA